eukprot:CAMPEP_0119301226 /NCGR_PEP_ID=MMETSP1333-20130426/3029_1 /TAXON_ID=418940 /ORGANISM="Scyphosphaera apsteinii, Strain RCC1455" /LENGTH=333 /DNA_ID=CAMNT_0007303241 /DNA_START=59 /DNA_END=1061 /DNA_ORIENTATION=+
MIILACSELSAVRADRSVDDTSIVAMLKVMQEQMQEQMAKLEDRIMAKDETIASLTAALQSKTEHRQVQLTVGGEVMQLVSEAEFKELASRVAKCEKTNADQDAKLGMTMDTLVKVRKEIKDARVGAPPALPPSPPPPLPPPQSVATPGRQLQFSSNGNSVNELSLKGPNAVTSWNSRTPGLTSFNCTGVGDGKLTCSGEMYATNFVTDQGNSVNMIAAQLAALNDSVSTVLGVGYCKVAPPTFVEHVGQVQTKVNADEWWMHLMETCNLSIIATRNMGNATGHRSQQPKLIVPSGQSVKRFGHTTITVEHGGLQDILGSRQIPMSQRAISLT